MTPFLLQIHAKLRELAQNVFICKEKREEYNTLSIYVSKLLQQIENSNQNETILSYTIKVAKDMPDEQFKQMKEHALQDAALQLGRYLLENKIIDLETIE